MPVKKAPAALVIAALLLSSAPSVPAQTAVPAQTGGAAPIQSPDVQPVPQAGNAREQQIIDNAERAYQTGLDNLHANHAQAARQSFDYSVDLLLTSGVDIKSHPALSEELDRIVDSINTLELDALRQGGNQQQGEPAPVDLANDVTFPVDPNVKARAIEELRTTQSDLPLVMNDYVASFINFFSTTGRGHATLVASLERAGKYKAMIQKVLKEEGVPQDLIYLAVAESGFRPRALNAHSGAAGMWQFMPYGTYGLNKTGWYDERFDPEKATRAYARDIKKTYEQLGDWYLTMAAYNWGTGNVQRAVQRTGYVDFWELYRRNNLPEQTKNYVPIILAVTIMAKNPKQYGLEGVMPDAAVLPDTVTTDYAIDLHLVADITGASLSTIEDLNPGLLRGRTPPDEAYDLHVPAGTKDLFTQRVAEIPADKRTSWRYHRVVAGDTIEDLARTFHTSASEIAFVNQIDASAGLTNVEALVIPSAPPPPVSSYGSAARTSVYKVRRGDTLVTIADRFGVQIEDLRAWNHLGGRAPQAGKKLYVAAPARLVRTSMRSSARGTRTAGRSPRTARGSAGASHRAAVGSVRAHGSAKTASARAPKHKAARR
jgi:membrane-bound lytic murein transglycosylase D